MRRLQLCLLLLLTITLFGAGPTLLHSQGVTDLSADQTQGRNRDIRSLQERIRLLYSQGKYADVIVEADALLEIDPGNSTALLNKDNAESRIARGESGPPKTPVMPMATTMAPPTTPQQPSNSEDPFGSPESGAQADATPAAANAGGSGPQTMGGGSLSDMSSEQLMTELFGPDALKKRKADFSVVSFLSYLFGIVAAVGLGAGGFVWLTSKDLPASQTAATTTSAGRVIGIEDMPTVTGDHSETPPSSQPPEGKHDMPTQVGQLEENREVIADQVTAIEPEHQHTAPEDTDYREAGETNPDSVNLNEETDEKPQAAVAKAPAKEEENIALEDDGGDNGGLVLDGAFTSEGQSGAGDEKPSDDEYGSMGLDYSAEDDSMFANSQVLDVYQTTPREDSPSQVKPAVQQAPSIQDEVTQVPAPKETEPTTTKLTPVPAAPKAPAEPDSDDALDIGLNIEMPPPSSASDEADDPAALSFSSLMFGAEETAAPGQSSPQKEEGKEEEPASEDITMGTFDQQYSNVMFGGDDEKTNFMPPSAESDQAPPSPQEELDADVTLRLDSPPLSADPVPPAVEAPSSEPEDDVTVILSPQTAPTPSEAKPKQPKPEAGPKVSMFDKQRDAGKEALEAEDYARAVQCLSVAASLKPGDKDVRALLEEARKKRRGV